MKNMIENFGIGTDIVSIDIFRKIPYEQKTPLYTKIFRETEIAYCLKFKDPYPHFAGKFAVKESVKKSIKKNIAMLEIETSHSNSKPTVKLVESKEKYVFLVSLSHEKDYAVATVISEKI